MRPLVLCVCLSIFWRLALGASEADPEGGPKEGLRQCADEACALAALGDNAAWSDDEAKHCILKGWWKCAKTLIYRSRDESRDISSAVRQGVREAKKDLDELLRLLDARNDQIQTISPAFQWAQSKRRVFIQIKFGYRWSSPGALSVEKETVTVTEESFHFDGIGTHSGQQKLYVLDVDFYDKISETATEWTFGSVGKLTVTFKKVNAEMWPRLTREEQKISNMHLWWDMYDRLSRAGFEDDEVDSPASQEAAAAPPPTASTEAPIPPRKKMPWLPRPRTVPPVGEDPHRKGRELAARISLGRRVVTKKLQESRGMTVMAFLVIAVCVAQLIGLPAHARAESRPTTGAAPDGEPIMPEEAQGDPKGHDPVRSRQSPTTTTS